jgi:DNA-binding CsgD family transcriptional regulator
MFGRTYKDHSALTASENGLLMVLATGVNVNEAADTIGIARKTARNRLETILDKLYVDTTHQAIAKWRAFHGRNQITDISMTAAQFADRAE